MTKRVKLFGRSARHGRVPSPYTKYAKRPFPYPWQRRTAQGDLMTKANTSTRNRYP